MVRPIDETFPALAKGGFQITSPVDKRYNCIAFAVGDTANWWWPFPVDVPEVFWPTGVPRAETLAAFRAAFATLGYSECASEEAEAGFEKIALFAIDQGVPAHAARQQPGGRWTSELGEREDITHDLRDLEGLTYGKVTLVMKRAVTNATGKQHATQQLARTTAPPEVSPLNSALPWSRTNSRHFMNFIGRHESPSDSSNQCAARLAGDRNGPDGTSE